MPSTLLTIAGTDPCSGAGIGADMAVMQEWGYHGTSVVTAVIAQNTHGVRSAWPVPAPHVEAQLDAILSDLSPAGIKIGVLGSQETVAVVAERLRTFEGPVVLDPVLASGQNGADLGGAPVSGAIMKHLLSRVALVTPNAPEAEAMTGLAIRGPEDQLQAARALVDAGAKAALVKGGHVPGTRGDVLVSRGGEATWFEVEHLYPYAVRGTGCHLSTALSASLVENNDVTSAVSAALVYMRWLWRTRARALGGGARVFEHAQAKRERW